MSYYKFFSLRFGHDLIIFIIEAPGSLLCKNGIPDKKNWVSLINVIDDEKPPTIQKQRV